MRSLLIAGCAVGAIAAVACTGAPAQSVFVTHARAPGTACDYADDTHYVESANFDVAATPFGMGQIFSWQNNLQATAITVGGDRIDSISKNDFTAKTVTVSYQTNPASSIPGDTVPIAASVPAGATSDKSSVAVPLITPAANGALLANIGSGGGITTVLATFTIRGTLQSGGTLETQPFTFPIYAYNSGFTGCPAGTVDVGAGQCGAQGVNIGALGNVTSLYCHFPDGGS